MIHFQDSKSVIDSWITTTGETYAAVIILDEIPITSMPSVQIKNFPKSINKSKMEYVKQLKSKRLQATYGELASIKKICLISYSFEIENVVKWASMESNDFFIYQQNESQPIESFNKQKLALK